MDEGHVGNKPVNMATELGGVAVPPSPPSALPEVIRVIITTITKNLGASLDRKAFPGQEGGRSVRFT